MLLMLSYVGINQIRTTAEDDEGIEVEVPEVTVNTASTHAFQAIKAVGVLWPPEIYKEIEKNADPHLAPGDGHRWGEGEGHRAEQQARLPRWLL